MIKYKYKEKENKFTENGHTMFEADVLTRLERLAYLEDEIKKGNYSKCNVSEAFFSSLILKAKELKELSDETEKMGDKVESFGLTAQGKGIIIAYDLLKSELNNAR